MLSWTCAAANEARGERDRAQFAGKTLLIVGTGGPARGPVFERIRSLGLVRVICLNATRNWATPYIDDWILANPSDPAGGAVAAVQELLAGAHAPVIDGVVTFDEFCVQVAANLAEALGLVGVGHEVADRVRNKLAFRQFCLANGLPAPRCVGLPPGVKSGLVAVRDAGLHYPLIFKPAFGAGKSMLAEVADEAELERAIDAHAVKVRTAPQSLGWSDHSTFVEEYLDGPEVDIDMLVQAGTVRYCEITDNLAASEPFFLETGGRFPSQLPQGTQRALRQMASDVASALGIQNGCIHFEAKATADGPVPIEVNLRLGGAEVQTFHRASRGIDLAAEAVKIALGVPVAPPVTDRPRCHLASTNFLPTVAGQLVAFDVAPEVWRSEALVQLVIFGEIGHPITLPPAGNVYLGWLVASGLTPEEARENVETLTRGVTFQINEAVLD
jgi:biotin carboxylase